MNNTVSLQKIKGTLNSLNEILQRIESNDSLHPIELDLMLEKTRQLYLELLELSSTGIAPKPVQKPSEPKIKEETEAIPQKLHEEKGIPSVEKRGIIEETFVSPPNTGIIEREMPADADNTTVGEDSQQTDKEEEAPQTEMQEEQKTPDTETHEAEEQQEKTDVESNTEDKNPPVLQPEPKTKMEDNEPPKTPLDLFSSSGDDTLSDFYEQQKTTAVGEKLGKEKLNDLREAIGINDKFQFINELFKGDMSTYNKLIDELNQFSGFAGAQTYLSELSVQYNWKKDSPVYQKFIEIVKKKYQ